MSKATSKNILSGIHASTNAWQNSPHVRRDCMLFITDIPSTIHFAFCTDTNERILDLEIRKFFIKAAFDPCLKSLYGDANAKGNYVNG